MVDFVAVRVPNFFAVIVDVVDARDLFDAMEAGKIAVPCTVDACVVV